MTIVSSLARGFYGARADLAGAPAPWDDYWYTPIGAPSVSGMRVTPETAKRLATVIAAVGAKSRALAVLPCLIYTDIPGGGKKVVRKHPLFPILHSRPNDMQTAFEFYQMLQGHVELRGNAYAEILTSSRGVIGELIPMHPDHVRVEMLSSGRLRYIYNDPLTNSTRTLLQGEVFHVRDWADSRAVGQSRITMAMDVYGVALAQQDYAGKFLKNDAASGVIVTGTNFETKQAEEEYKAAFLASATGENRHKIKLLPPGVDIKTLGVKPSDMQLLDASKASDIKICSIHNILPHLIGVDTGRAATYASVEQFNLMHAQQSVLPMAVMWEQAIQRDLMDDDRFYAKFSLAELLRGDFATRTTGYAVAIEHGWLSPDDVRELEDMNPIKGGIGRQYFRPLNWTTLDAPAALPPSSGNQDGVSEEDDDQEPETGSGADPQDQSALRSRLELMAQDSAARCVRREVNALRKMVQNEASAPQIEQFYAEHFRFICGVFHFTSLATVRAKQGCDARKSEFTRWMAEGDAANAIRWIETVAATQPAALAALAVEGVL